MAWSMKFKALSMFARWPALVQSSHRWASSWSMRSVTVAPRATVPSATACSTGLVGETTVGLNTASWAAESLAANRGRPASSR